MADPTPEAAQATTAAPESSIAAPVAEPQVVADPSAAADAVSTRHVGRNLTPAAPLPPRPKGRPYALDAAKAALAKMEADKAAAAKPADKPAIPAGDTPATTEAPTAADAAKDTPATPPKEPDKPAEKPERISKGLAILAAREADVRRQEIAIKQQRAELEALRNAAPDPDLALVKQVKDALAKGGRAAALQALGIDLRTAVEELSRTYSDPTPEDIARKIAREELEAHQKTLSEQAEAQQRAVAEKEAARVQVARTEFAQKVAHEFTKAADDFPSVSARNVTDLQVVEYAAQMEAKERRAIQPLEALKAMESEFEAQDKRAAELRERRAAKTKPPTPAIIAPAAAPPAAKFKPESKPAEQRSREPAQPNPPPRFQRSTALSAAERARRAMESLGIK